MSPRPIRAESPFPDMPAWPVLRAAEITVAPTASLLAACLAAVLTFLSGCERASEEVPDCCTEDASRRATDDATAAAPPSSDSPAAAGPPIILVAVDTLRPDHLPIYGYTKKTAPALTNLAESSVVFDRAFTTAPKTAPAFASLFTGMYPHRHGLRILGQELHEENVTLAERLAAAGYDTAGFVSSTVMIDRLSGLAQGFGHWDDRMPSRELNRDNYERTARGTMDAALAWLSATAEAPAPFFLFVHLIDPHGPYLPPSMFRVRFARRQGPEIDPAKVPEFQRLPGAEVVGDYLDAYDGEVNYADFELGRLMTELIDREILDEALVIFTADHGESFGEDGFWFRHGKTLHEVSTRIPLVVKPPGGRLESVDPRSAGTVSLIDLAPTILDYAGLDAPTDLDGLSLRPVLEGRSAARERIVFSERWLPGRRSWAAHFERGTLYLSGCADGASEGSEACDETYLGRLSSGKLIEIDKQTATRSQLRTAVDAFSARATASSPPFRVKWRYRPADKKFVKRFVDQHNLEWENLSDADYESLEKLGYVDD